MEEINATHAQLATMNCRVVCNDSLKWVCCVGLQLPLIVVSSPRLSRKSSFLELRFFLPSGAAAWVFNFLNDGLGARLGCGVHVGKTWIPSRARLHSVRLISRFLCQALVTAVECLCAE